MEIIVKSIGLGSNSHIEALEKAYLTKLRWKVKILEYKAVNLSDIAARKAEEARILTRDIKHNSFIYALDENGKSFSSPEFSSHISLKIQEYKTIYFLVGGALGLGPEVKEKANLLLSLGRMTFPHQIARLLLLEQLYRSYTIQCNHPYHKL